jgi:hypothetical protein
MYKPISEVADVNELEVVVRSTGHKCPAAPSHTAGPVCEPVGRVVSPDNDQAGPGDGWREQGRGRKCRWATPRRPNEPRPLIVYRTAGLRSQATAVAGVDSFGEKRYEHLRVGATPSGDRIPSSRRLVSGHGPP